MSTLLGVSIDGQGLILRPNRRDEVVRRKAAEMALPEVKGWMGSDTGGRDDNDLVEGLMKHIGGWEAFEICKNLDRDGWGADARLVEIMDRDFAGDAEKEMVRQWVQCLGIRLGIPVGAPVTWREQQGEVVTHEPDVAQYGVRTPDQKDGWRHVCNAEDVKLTA